MRELGFQKAEFKVDIKQKAEAGPAGTDDVEFLFSANPGEPPRPLVKVASGGELSRIMLGLKCLESDGRTVSKEGKAECKPLRRRAPWFSTRLMPVSEGSQLSMWATGCMHFPPPTRYFV